MHDAVDLREMLEVHGVFRELDEVHAHFAAVVPSPVNKLARYLAWIVREGGTESRFGACSAWYITTMP